MPNRFARRIRDGEIDSPEALASEFRALAKATHPDLAGPGADPQEFVRVRAEYETALRDFERHRFGSRKAGAEAESERGGSFAAESFRAWTALGLLLKRGFPKEPRHEKERLRYEYALWRLARELPALGEDAARRFGPFAAAMSVLKGSSPAETRRVVALLRELLEYRRTGIEALRTSIAHGLETLRRSPLDPSLVAFMEALAGIRLDSGAPPP
ncbi:MAG: hypothetical protein JXA15_11315 [Spirochaetales bacterium]|nr:hypothetical protein [Spirochaetales bacterium]